MNNKLNKKTASLLLIFDKHAIEYKR